MRQCAGGAVSHHQILYDSGRALKKAHADKREIALMTRLCPEFQRASDVVAQLKDASSRHNGLENVLDWLGDGVALLRADGHVAYANSRLSELTRRDDGFRIIENAIEFADPEAHARFALALGAIERVRGASTDSQLMDFPVPRSSGMLAYIVSVRPLAQGQPRTIDPYQVKIILFIRDPAWRNPATSEILKNLFCLTNAEAHLAQALCTGMTTGAYASGRGVSLNTVYSHLKRIREKTGCKSVPELILKFGEFNVPLRQK